MDLTEQAREIFEDDRFAREATGIVIEKADVHYARCSLKLEPKHLNARGAVMGGVIFTLADFTFAIAASSGNLPTVVTLSSSIQFLNSAKGEQLIAETSCEKEGKSTCCYTLRIWDELGTEIAAVTSVGFHMEG
jgi:acyl-CoA thioesterase